MVLAVTHPFVSGKSDGADATLVQPSNWNASHSLSGTVALTNGGTGQASALLSRQALIADGLGQPLNLALTASAAASALTIALKGNDGNDPSATNPVVVPFRNATATTGDATSLTVTAATSLVISSGSTLGVTTSTAFRIWVVAFNDGGTFRLGAINCATLAANASWNIFALDEAILASAVSEGGAGAADSAGVFYSNATVTTKAYRVLGYLEWSLTGLTAGTWTTSALLVIQLKSPGVHLPGAIVQAVSLSTATETATTSSTFQACTNLSKALTLTSAANLLRSKLSGSGLSAAPTVCDVTIAAAGTAIGQIGQVYMNVATSTPIGTIGIDQLSKPNSISSITYDARVKSSDNTTSVNFPETSQGGYGILELQEIQG